LTHRKQQKIFWHVKGRGYNKNCVLYPRLLTCQKEFVAWLCFLYTSIIGLTGCYKRTVLRVYASH